MYIDITSFIINNFFELDYIYIKYYFFLELLNIQSFIYHKWGLGIGDWGLGIGGLGFVVLGLGPKPPTPNPQSPIPNPHIFNYK
jgi:hypothetical protein